MRFRMKKSKPASFRAALIGWMNSSICFSFSSWPSSIFALMSWYASGSLYLSQIFSISDFTSYRPSRWASGMKTNMVSDRILSRLNSGMNSMVRQLCSRSASLMRTTRTSSLRVSRIRLKFSAWMLYSLKLLIPVLFSESSTFLILVSPATRLAIFSPKRLRISSDV